MIVALATMVTFSHAITNVVGLSLGGMSSHHPGFPWIKVGNVSKPPKGSEKKKSELLSATTERVRLLDAFGQRTRAFSTRESVGMGGWVREAVAVTPLPPLPPLPFGVPLPPGLRLPLPPLGVRLPPGPRLKRGPRPPGPSLPVVPLPVVPLPPLGTPLPLPWDGAGGLLGDGAGGRGGKVGTRVCPGLQISYSLVQKQEREVLQFASVSEEHRTGDGAGEKMGGVGTPLQISLSLTQKQERVVLQLASVSEEQGPTGAAFLPFDSSAKA